ncbi:flagellar hook-length control protein FliK [Sphingomonas mucosissima]|uniref:Flagellar hook-length control protein FliK n=2 Tax=Sphingomonas mucosissima TaxID=370959 RepID=A0A245ZLW5_9SPHN|nr:flagellar hook-length control protein FliK [Sphingomonas mucosissima]
MLSIPHLLVSAPSPEVVGAVPAAASPGVDFAALLLAGVAPIMPRQRDGEGGNNLPAAFGKDEERADPAATNVWIAPPTWLVPCPPPAPVNAGDAPLEPAAAMTGSIPQGSLLPGQLPAGLPEPLAGDETLAATDAAASPARAEAAAPPAPATPIVPTVKERGASSLPLQDDVERVTLDPAPSLPLKRQASTPTATPVQPGSVPNIVGVSPSPASLAAATPAAALPPQQTSPNLPQQQLAEAPGHEGTSAPSKPDAQKERGVHTQGNRFEASAPSEGSADRPPIPAGVQRGAAPPQLAPPAHMGPVAPAAQMFAAAIHRAARDERRAETPAGLIPGIAPATDLAPHAVAAVENSRHAALDMAREAWPTRMIERIEMIRDAMDAVDTSIRLVPDKLGTIDVSLRRDGDAVAVHFHAQQAETRQLLAEAQPKLAELAEAKGLKLSAQAGSDPGPQHQQHQQRAPTSAPFPTSRQSRVASHDDASTADERIA